MTSQDLLVGCRKVESGGSAAEAGYCLGYVRGVADMLIVVDLMLKRKCEDIHPISAGQLAAILVKYLEAHPEKWHEPPAPNIVSALRDAFPCPSGEGQ